MVPPPPTKYKKRRRIYERLKTNNRYTSLATVPEGEELRDAHTWFGPKLAGVLVTLLVCAAGLKELSKAFTQGTTKDGQLRGRETTIKSKQSGQSEEEQRDAAEAYALTRNVQIPTELNFLAGVYDPVLPTDRAFLWQIPRSASGTIKAIAARCFGLLVASEVGAASVSDRLTIISDLEGGKYVNVDTSTAEGIDKAKQIGLTSLPGLNLISTSFFYDAAVKLFSETNRGRCVVMMRHPVERAASLFAVHVNEPNSPITLTGMSLSEYANSDRAERNWMTRFLSNTQEGELTTEHLAIAMKILETKCLIGLLKFKGESMRRIENYFGWTIDGEKASDCHTKLLDWNWINKNKHMPVKEGSEVWRKLADVNDMDMKLYKHAERLYKIQGDVLFKGSI